MARENRSCSAGAARHPIRHRSGTATIAGPVSAGARIAQRTCTGRERPQRSPQRKKGDTTNPRRNGRLIRDLCPIIYVCNREIPVQAMKKRNVLPIALLAIALLGLGACSDESTESDDPAEEAGEKVDEAVEKAEDTAEEAAQEAGEAVEEAGDAVEEATD